MFKISMKELNKPILKEKIKSYFKKILKNLTRLGKEALLKLIITEMISLSLMITGQI
jgi:hypothetical protein